MSLQEEPLTLFHLTDIHINTALFKPAAETNPLDTRVKLTTTSRETGFHTELVGSWSTTPRVWPSRTNQPEHPAGVRSTFIWHVNMGVLL